MVVIVAGSLQTVMSVENIDTVNFREKFNEFSTLVHFPESVCSTINCCPLAVRLVFLDVIMKEVPYATLFLSEAKNYWPNMVHSVAFMIVARSAQRLFVHLDLAFFVVLDARFDQNSYHIDSIDSLSIDVVEWLDVWLNHSQSYLIFGGSPMYIGFFVLFDEGQTLMVELKESLVVICTVGVALESLNFHHGALILSQLCQQPLKTLDDIIMRNQSVINNQPSHYFFSCMLISFLLSACSLFFSSIRTSLLWAFSCSVNYLIRSNLAFVLDVLRRQGKYTLKMISWQNASMVSYNVMFVVSTFRPIFWIIRYSSRLIFLS